MRDFLAPASWASLSAPDLRAAPAASTVLPAAAPVVLRQTPTKHESVKFRLNPRTQPVLPAACLILLPPEVEPL